MPKGSEQLTQARRDEIVAACAALYETRSFRDITLRDIGARTSFTRTSIYNYFQTKEEIFLALLQTEYEAWTADLEAVAEAAPAPGRLADALAHSLEKRGRMLKLLSMDLYTMERSSRLERLTDFKRAYAAALAALRRCLERSCPAMGPEDREDFLYAFLPFLFGVYPYTQATEKQKAAMEAAGLHVPQYTVYTITKPLVEALLGPFQGR